MNSAAWLGALVGLMAATGVLIAVHAAPPARPIRLADRIGPYLGETPLPSKLLAKPVATSTPFEVVRRLFGPAMGEMIGLVDRLAGGTTSVRRRLRGLGDTMSLEDFRLEQVLWGAGGMVAAAALAVGLGTLRGAVHPVLVGAVTVGGLVGGVLGRDWYLSRQLRKREETMLAEFPVVADLLALSVVAGEAPVDALARVCRLTRGEMARDLETALAGARGGRPITHCLSDLAERTTLEAFARFLDGLVVAIERGTPLAGLLRAQAADVREAGKRALLEAGGRKEISMMASVVFLILPVTVLFALFPGLLTLTSLSH